MKKTIQNKILTVLLILLVCSCADKKWDDYYVTPEYLKDGSTFDVLSKNPDYKEFTSLLKKTGYDSLLSRHDVFTVFALPNGAFTGIDTTTDLAALKKNLSMQILSSDVFKKDMAGGNKLGISGKLLKFATTTEGITVNSILITKFDTKTINGVIHETGNMILAAPNLYDVIMADPDLSSFKNFIASSYIPIIDPVNNIKLGYDTANKPIYKAPINYIPYSEYLKFTGAQDEKVLTTGFFPSDAAVNKVIAGMLPARNNQLNLIVPRLRKAHPDTLVGGRFFRKGIDYPGDTAALLQDLFKIGFIRAEIPVLANNSNSFTNVLGNLFTVTKAQVKTDARVASNGYYYVLNDVTVPDTLYRKPFWFTPRVQNPAVPNDPTNKIFNPDITYTDFAGTPPVPEVTAAILNISIMGSGAEVTLSTPCTYYRAYTGEYVTFNFGQPGPKVDFRIPYVIKGNYKVELSYYMNNNNGLISVSYGAQKLAQNLNLGTEKASVTSQICTVINTGTINVVSDGPVTIRFTCTGTNQTGLGKFRMTVDFMRLTPVIVP